MIGPRAMLRPAACGLLLLLIAMTAAPAVLAEDDPVKARTFEVRYRPLSDVANLLGPELSAEGTLTLRPSLRLIVVQDRESVLRRVQELLESYDLPPRSVEVTFTLVLGRDTREERKEPASPHSVFTDEVRGIIEALRNVTKWIDYKPLGSRSITGTEGRRIVAELSDEYRVEFQVGSISTRQGEEFVDFESIVLQRVKRGDDGEERVSDLYVAAGAQKAGQLKVVAGATSPEAGKALFLILQVEAP